MDDILIVDIVVTARSAHVAMAIPMMGYALAYVFPIYVNFFNKDTMDSRRDTNLNIESRPMEKDLELERNASSDEGTKHTMEIVEQKAA
jgi:FHS family L-fucose permease-like MFS transporter